jgi:phytanoyl-CoA hydroxylase
MDAIDLAFYRHQGHLTVNGVLPAAETDALIADIEAWGESFLADLPAEQRSWYIDGGVKARTVLRKLDNPHAHRPAVRRVASDPRLVALVERILGAGVSVYFSQVFFKAPEGGGPKPAHQDNFYFGQGTHQGPVYDHVAPPGEPFNLQLPSAVLDKQPMAPAPVRKGGVSFHHGNTFHQSGPNHSRKWRRACALHYVRNGVEFATPALPYDHALKLRIT